MNPVVLKNRPDIRFGRGQPLSDRDEQEKKEDSGPAFPQRKKNLCRPSFRLTSFFIIFSRKKTVFKRFNVLQLWLERAGH